MSTKAFGVMAGSIVLLCMASAVKAEPRDSVDRGDRMDRDAIRDDVRTNRLTVPRHPLSAEQPPPPQQPASPAAKQKSKKRGEVR
jgi:hypothetical protein